MSANQENVTTYGAEIWVLNKKLRIHWMNLRWVSEVGEIAIQVRSTSSFKFDHFISGKVREHRKQIRTGKSYNKKPACNSTEKNVKKRNKKRTNFIIQWKALCCMERKYELVCPQLENNWINPFGRISYIENFLQITKRGQ